MAKFHHSEQKKSTKRKPHRWWNISMGKRSTAGFPWPICIYCGLVGLKNEATAKEVRAGCRNSDDHED